MLLIQSLAFLEKKLLFLEKTDNYSYRIKNKTRQNKELKYHWKNIVWFHYMKHSIHTRIVFVSCFSNSSLSLKSNDNSYTHIRRFQTYSFLTTILELRMHFIKTLVILTAKCWQNCQYTKDFAEIVQNRILYFVLVKHKHLLFSGE